MALPVSKSLPFAGPSRPSISTRLRVAGRHVVEDRVAEDVLQRALLRRVLDLALDEDAELELEIEKLGIGGPDHVVFGPDHREAVRLVVDRLLVEDRRRGQRTASLDLGDRLLRIGPLHRRNLARRGESLLEVQLEAQAVPHLRRAAEFGARRRTSARERMALAGAFLTASEPARAPRRRLRQSPESLAGPSHRTPPACASDEIDDAGVTVNQRAGARRFSLPFFGNVTSRMGLSSLGPF